MNKDKEQHIGQDGLYDPRTYSPDEHKKSHVYHNLEDMPHQGQVQNTPEQQQDSNTQSATWAPYFQPEAESRDGGVASNFVSRKSMSDEV